MYIQAAANNWFSAGYCITAPSSDMCSKPCDVVTSASVRQCDIRATPIGHAGFVRSQPRRRCNQNIRQLPYLRRTCHIFLLSPIFFTLAFAAHQAVVHSGRCRNGCVCTCCVNRVHGELSTYLYWIRTWCWWRVVIITENYRNLPKSTEN